MLRGNDREHLLASLVDLSACPASQLISAAAVGDSINECDERSIICYYTKHSDAKRTVIYRKDEIACNGMGM
jgi:hypothetical protein